MGTVFAWSSNASCAPQIKFGSTDELVAELKHNVEETKELLGAE